MSGPPASHTIDDLLVHARWLNRLAHHLVRDSDFAADLTQEVWLAAHRAPPDRTRPVRPWLKEVLRNAVRMRLRRAGRQLRAEEAAPSPEPFPSPAVVQEQLELQRELVEAVMTLLVVDAATDSAIANAEVRASTDVNEQTKTADAAGRIAFANLPAGGKARLFVSAPGYAPANNQIDVPGAAGAVATVVKLTRAPAGK